MLTFRHYSNIFEPNLDLERLKKEINFTRENINNNGEWIPESRLTCWMSDYDITLEYSEKSMKPNPLTPYIKEIRQKLFEKFNIYFDSVLANYYGDNTIGMRYHSDPILDKWDTNFMIVSIGDSRNIIFRDATNFDTKFKFELKNGDIIHMFDDCQDKYQHSIRKEKVAKNTRISLVFKRSIKK